MGGAPRGSGRSVPVALWDSETRWRELKNGVLTVTLPKSVDAKPRQIEVNQAEAAIAKGEGPTAIEAPEAVKAVSSTA